MSTTGLTTKIIAIVCLLALAFEAIYELAYWIHLITATVGIVALLWSFHVKYHKRRHLPI